MLPLAFWQNANMYYNTHHSVYGERKNNSFTRKVTDVNDYAKNTENVLNDIYHCATSQPLKPYDTKNKKQRNE